MCQPRPLRSLPDLYPLEVVGLVHRIARRARPASPAVGAAALSTAPGLRSFFALRFELNQRRARALRVSDQLEREGNRVLVRSQVLRLVGFVHGLVRTGVAVLKVAMVLDALAHVREQPVHLSAVHLA